MSQLVEAGQVWEVDMTNKYGSIHSIVLVLEPIMYGHGQLGYPGVDLLTSRRIRLFTFINEPLPDAWKRIA